MTQVQTVAPQFRGIPALDIDKQIAEIGGGKGAEVKLDARQVLERRIAWNLIKHLEANGWRVHKVWDGEVMERPADAKAAMELVFNLDEVWVYFTNAAPGEKIRATGKQSHGVYLVLGNGIDIVSDWGYSSGDADDFDAVMEAFDAEQYA